MLPQGFDAPASKEVQLVSLWSFFRLDTQSFEITVRFVSFIDETGAFNQGVKNLFLNT